MQERLFNDHRVEIDDSHDPYAEFRKSAEGLADEYEVSAEEALDLILSHGSEWAARRALDQRWWLSDDVKAA